MQRDYLSACPTTRCDDLSKANGSQKETASGYVICRSLAVSLTIDQLALLNAFELMALGPKELWLRGLHLWEPAAETDWLKLP